MDGYDIKVFSTSPLELNKELDEFDISEIYINHQMIESNQKILYVQLNDAAREKYGIDNENDTIYTSLDVSSEILAEYSNMYSIQPLDSNINSNVKYILFPESFQFENKDDAQYIYYLFDGEGQLDYRNNICKDVKEQYDAKCSKKFDIYTNITVGLNFLIVGFILIMLGSVYSIQKLAAMHFEKTRGILKDLGLKASDINSIFLIERMISIGIITCASILLIWLFGNVNNISLYTIIIIVTMCIIALIGSKGSTKQSKIRIRKKVSDVDMKRYIAISLNGNRLLSVVMLFLSIATFSISLLLLSSIQQFSIENRVSETINNDYLFEEVPLYDSENNKYYTYTEIDDKLTTVIQENKNTIMQARAAYRAEDDTDYGYTSEYANLGVYTYEEQIFDGFNIPKISGNEVIIKVNPEFGKYTDDETFLYNNGKVIKVGDVFRIKDIEFRVKYIVTELPIMTDYPKIAVLMETQMYENMYGDSYNILAVNTHTSYSDEFLENLKKDNLNIISYDEIYKEIQRSISKLYYMSLILVIIFLMIMYIVLFNVLVMRVKVKQDEIKLYQDLGFENHKILMLVFGDQFLILFMGAICVLIAGLLISVGLVVLAENFVISTAFLILVFLTVKYLCKPS